MTRVALVDARRRRSTRPASCSPARTRSATACGRWASSAGDTVAALPAERRSRCSRCTSAALQIGLYFTPINHHLVGPEVAYIVDDSEAKVFVSHERFAERATAAADEIGFPADGRFAVGAVDGFRPSPSSATASPTTPPEGRTAGAADALHVGHDRPPEGREAGLADIDPDDMAALIDDAPEPVRHRAARTTTSTSPARRSTTRRC